MEHKTSDSACALYIMHFITEWNCIASISQLSICICSCKQWHAFTLQYGMIIIYLFIIVCQKSQWDNRM